MQDIRHNVRRVGNRRKSINQGSALPDPNPDARGLRISSPQFEGILLWVKGQESVITRAWIFGSRITGVRTKKDEAVASDIDLAVEIINCDEQEAALWHFELRKRMRDFLDQYGRRFQLSPTPDYPDHLSLEIVTSGSTVEQYLKQSSLQIYP